MKKTYGILFVQLGTPDAPTVPAVKRYLKEFLSDRRVVDAPRFIWWLILRLKILRTRPAISAQNYMDIWTEKGSPLRTLTEDQVAFFKNEVNVDVEVTYAMRYGTPTIREKLIEFKAKEITDLYIVPLYPQYSSSTTGSVMEVVYQTVQHFRYIPNIRVCAPFYEEAFYIDGCVRNILEVHNNTPFNTLILSYHGIPQRYADLGDPYHQMCLKTTERISEKLSGITVIHSYQSRFGKEPWLKPYTDEVIKTLNGDIGILSPSFVTDCLETTHELGIELKEEYKNGELLLIPCLNADPHWLSDFKEFIKRDTFNWNMFNK